MKLLTALPLALALAAPFAAPAAAQIADMTDADREAFRAEVRSYLLDNPEVLMEAIAVLEQRQNQAQAMADNALVETYRDQLVDDGFSWVGGNPDGDITVVEFMDYRCGYCRRAFSEVEALVAGDGNIRLILKEFPILGEQSLVSSQFAVAVQQLHGDDVYKDVHDALIALEADATPDTLARLAEGFGLDPAPILERMAAPEVAEVISANHALGDLMQITGTPTFVIGGQMVRGYVPIEQMLTIVRDQREG